MRNPDRLDKFYDEVSYLHRKYFPDWRVGQFWTNFERWLMGQKRTDPFFPEEPEILDFLREFCGEEV